MKHHLLHHLALLPLIFYTLQVLLQVSYFFLCFLLLIDIFISFDPKFLPLYFQGLNFVFILISDLDDVIVFLADA